MGCPVGTPMGCGFPVGQGFLLHAVFSIGMESSYGFFQWIGVFLWVFFHGSEVFLSWALPTKWSFPKEVLYSM